ncbi:MAG: low molecular weight protein-tyrosine-phosphatase [Acidiferrobacter sp.]
MIKVLFVCLGNICRSPMAEGLFRDLIEKRDLADRVHIDSAGTHGYHIGAPPDERARQTMARHGVDIGAFEGRKVDVVDLDQFDYVLAMDRSNLRDLERLGGGSRPHVRLFLEFARASAEREVPDPYYGGPDGFEHVYALLEDAAAGLLADIEQRLNQP